MLYPYKMGSNSAKVLSQALGIKQIKHVGSKFKGKPEKMVINWGSSSLPEEVEKCMIINEAKFVKIASNKLSFFNFVNGKVNIPDFTTDRDEARKWSEDGVTVVVRETLTGHSGEGVIVLEDVNQFDAYNHYKAKMYVRYIPKKDEFRVHVINGEVVDVRRKALKNGVHKDDANWKIRTYQTGFIFAKEGFKPPQEVLDEGVKAVEACGLHFGAVDVAWNAFYEKAYVLEVNSAPGLEGSSIDTYKEAFEQFYKQPYQKKYAGVKLTDLIAMAEEEEADENLAGIKPKKGVAYKPMLGEVELEYPNPEPVGGWKIVDEPGMFGNDEF